MKNVLLGEVLKEYGYLTEVQLQHALEEQKNNRSKRLGAILIELGYITEQQLLHALGDKLSYPVIALGTYPVDIEAVEKIPRQLAVKYGMIGIQFREGRLVVAMNDPLNFYGVEDVRQVANMPLEICLSEIRKIKEAIDYYYAEIEAKAAAVSANLSVAEDQGLREAAAVAEEAGEDDAAPVVKLLNTLLVRGYSTGASDIHIEPYEEETIVRMRIDGMVIKYISLAKYIHQSLIARIKILGNMDIAERRLPQDGHFRTTLDGFEMNIRVSVIPTVYGEKAVLRFLTMNVEIDHSGQFGMSERSYQKVVEMLNNPYGIVYLTGPTGSGKTTTLYMILEYLAKRQVNICTIEDPVERNVAKLNQMQVNNQAGLTFERGLRAMLRQDPDVIMVGETRDNETASISARAAITGHLVLSTLHTNNAVSTIIRLVDMSVPPYLIANSLVGVVAQRLVKKICSHCKYEYEPEESEKAMLGGDFNRAWRGAGCHMCNHTGYKGRISVHEVLVIDGHVRQMISHGAPMAEIQKYAMDEQGMETLRQSMARLVREGITTVDEWLKVTYYED